MGTVDEGGFSGRDHIDHDVALQCRVREPLFFCSHVFITKLNHRYFSYWIFILRVFVWCCRFFWFSASSTRRCVDVFLFSVLVYEDGWTIPSLHSSHSPVLEALRKLLESRRRCQQQQQQQQKHESVFFTLSITRAIFKWQCMRQIISNIIDFLRLFVSLPLFPRRFLTQESTGTHVLRWRCWQRENSGRKGMDHIK